MIERDRLRHSLQVSADMINLGFVLKNRVEARTRTMMRWRREEPDAMTVRINVFPV
jgi:hypothetical protein